MTNLVAVNSQIEEYSLSEEARQYINNSKADNTKRSYSSDWADFTAYCLANRAQALPASIETVIDYRISPHRQGQHHKPQGYSHQSGTPGERVSKPHPLPAGQGTPAGHTKSQGHRPTRQGRLTHFRHSLHDRHAAE